MELIVYSSEYNDQPTKLIKLHHRLVPPYVELSDLEITNILEHPSHFIDLRFPSENVENKIFLYVIKGKVICATQIKFLKNNAYFCWMVCNPEFINHFHEFVNLLKSKCASKGCRSIRSHKNIFGVGWEGIPDCWEGILEGMLSIGFQIEDRWQCYWSNGIFNEYGSPPAVAINMEYENSRTIEMGIYDNGSQIGEASIWLPSELSESLTDFGIADIEYIEIYKKYRRKGYGQALLLAIQKELNAIGFEKFMLWTELDNIAMQKLAERIGFTKGPIFYWLHTDITN